MENILTAHIIVSSVGVQASTRMQTTEPTDLAEKWGIVLEAARGTFECTTQRGLQTVLHPSLRRRFRTNDRQFQYKRLQHDVVGDILLARTKSKRGNKSAEVFFTKFGWSRVFPMAKKGGAHEALSVSFQRYGLPPKIIVNGLKEQTLNVRLQRLSFT